MELANPTAQAHAAARVVHAIEPVFDARSRVLVLGTMPSPASREAGFFYGHPQNRFWRVLAALFDEPTPRSIADKRDFLLRRHIALWDVLASCDIEGASDASIKNARPNDLRRILDAADIEAIFCTGAKAAQLYRALCEPSLGMPCIALPSTSPANAAMRLPALIDAYETALMPYLAPAQDALVTLDVAQVAELEQRIATGGTPMAELMERAGRALAKAALDAWNARTACVAPEANGTDVPARPRVVALCGTGNNGGDGWVAASELAALGCDVAVITPCEGKALAQQPAHDAALRAEAALIACPDACRILVRPDAAKLTHALDNADIVIDAMLGTGFSGREVRAPYNAWVRASNARRETGALVVAADVPSGLSAQTGRAATPCIKADITVTMMTLKPGLATPYAFAYCGKVRVVPIAYIAPHLEAMGYAEGRPRRVCRASAVGTMPHTACRANAAESLESANSPAPHPHNETAETGAHPASAGKSQAGASPHPARTSPSALASHRAVSPAKPAAPRDEFCRPEAEDDDGYDPYSDRRPDPEPLFERNPWD